MSVFIIQWQLSSNNISFCFFSSVAPSSSSFSSIYCSSSERLHLCSNLFCFLMIFVCLLQTFVVGLFLDFFWFLLDFFQSSFLFWNLFLRSPFSDRQFSQRFLRFLIYSFSRQKSILSFFFNRLFSRLKDKNILLVFFKRLFSRTSKTF